MATVDDTGLVTTLTNGVAVITASDLNGCNDSWTIYSLSVEVESEKAFEGAFTVYEGNDNHPAVILNLQNPFQFECGTTDVQEPCSASDDPDSIVIFYDEVTDSSGNIEPYDINLNLFPSEVEDITWSKVAGPESGSLTQSDQSTAIFSSPAEGGLYQFDATIDDINTRVNLLLPLAGADITTWLNQECQDVGAWAIAQRQATEDANFNWNPLVTRRAVFQVWGTISGALFDYVLDPISANGNAPCRHFQPPIEEGGNYGYITLDGVVVHGSKINNMLWAIFGRNWGYETPVLLNGSHLNQVFRTWELDNPSSQSAIQYGGLIYECLLVDGNCNASEVLDGYEGLLQETSSLNEEKMWPATDSLSTANSTMSRPDNLPTTP